MNKFKNTVAVILALVSIYMALHAFTLFVNTSGEVQGSEFGMLITLAHQVSLLMIWLAVFAFWRIIPVEDTKA